MSKTDKNIVVIGAGAAGYFAAIHAASAQTSRVMLLEKTTKVLTKVKVSGGGRCNVTHTCGPASQLVKFYPRGGKSLKKAFGHFGTEDTVAWFERRGVKLKTEEDGRMFPVSDDSQSIVDCLQSAAREKGVELRLKAEVIRLQPKEGGFELHLKNGEKLLANKVIVSTGGSNKQAAYEWLKSLGLKVAKPIPSLFTFNVPDSDLKDLLGLSVNHGWVQVPGSKWKQEGPLLITHWGFSAPAVIKLSAWQAIDFYERSYQFPILINWTGKEENGLREELLAFAAGHPKKLVSGNQLFEIPQRLWQRLCEKAGINPQQRYHNLPKKLLNRMVEMLVRCPYQVNGKTTFKEEFVTCGGVELQEVNLATFEAKSMKGLYLAGEVLNVDGLTGGFNFQHAWTSGYLAGRAAGKSLAGI